jgi:hypothetical protein
VPVRNDAEIRAFRDQVMGHIASGRPLVDVRSPAEYTGELTHMESYPQEGALRGGHIPGAVSKPWKSAANDDGTFKPADELVKIYRTSWGWRPATTSSRTAGSASGPATPGSCCTTCSVSAGAQLRRLVDRVGQPGPGADRRGPEPGRRCLTTSRRA